MSRRFRRILAIIALLGLAVAAFVAAGGLQLFDWQTISHYRDAWRGWIGMHLLLGGAAYFLLYVVVAALSIPVAASLTLIAGSLFGLIEGTIIVSFASVGGATLAMLASRFLLRDMVETKFGRFMSRVNQGVQRDGARYLFGLRLVPVIPFFVVNLAMGLTQVRVVTFAWVSQLGMLPTTILYVNAGSQLMSIQSAGDLVSWRLLAALIAVALFPFAAKAVMGLRNTRALYAKWPRPKKTDYNLIVVGAGSAGLVTAYIAAAASSVSDLTRASGIA